MSGKKIQASGNGSRYFARKWKWVLCLHLQGKRSRHSIFRQLEPREKGTFVLLSLSFPFNLDFNQHPLYCFKILDESHRKFQILRSLKGRGDHNSLIQHEEQQRPGARKRLSADLENLTVCKQSCKSETVIYYYSMYCHVAKLAEEIKKGASSVEGVEVKLWQVPETLSDEVLGKMGTPPKSDVPFIEPNELAEADGFIFGFPTRFGMMAVQFKAFLDATGGLWRTQQLAGKPAGIFYGTGSQCGGQETTAKTAITQLVHHGMIFVPIGYTFGASMFEMEKVKGGSPYGAGTYAGDGSRQPSELELEQAFHQGKYIASIAKKLKEAT